MNEPDQFLTRTPLQKERQIEDVARAIAKAQHGTDQLWANYKRGARAAINVLSERV